MVKHVNVRSKSVTLSPNGLFQYSQKDLWAAAAVGLLSSL